MTRGLQLRQDAAFENADWRFQSLIWILSGGFVAAALAGLLGSGPLDHGRLETPGGAVLTFARHPRMESATEWDLRFQAEPGKTGVSVGLDASCLDRARLERIDPDPEASSVAAAGWNYRFRVDTGARQVVLRFRVTPELPGMMSCRLWVAGNPLPFRQWVYP
jgi:hypothetical protein